MDKKKLIQFDDPTQIKGLKKICQFSELKLSEIFGLIKDYNILSQTDKALWAIFGNGKEIERWTCLEVGSSQNIKSELREILRLMISEPQIVKKATTFHKDVYEFCTYKDKASVKYRAMYQLCEEFVVYEIDVREYLAGTDIEKYDSVNYAEVKFACETRALYWNPAPETYGNQEREIFKKIGQTACC